MLRLVLGRKLYGNVTNLFSKSRVIELCIATARLGEQRYEKMELNEFSLLGFTSFVPSLYSPMCGIEISTTNLGNANQARYWLFAMASLLSFLLCANAANRGFVTDIEMNIEMSIKMF
uniref:Uncharacterized protein n=1 Tax=Glossina brevipalpis TaxID=37001 RepID=A0A1A9X3L4_9MUSC